MWMFFFCIICTVLYRHQTKSVKKGKIRKQLDLDNRITLCFFLKQKKNKKLPLLLLLFKIVHIMSFIIINNLTIISICKYHHY